MNENIFNLIQKSSALNRWKTRLFEEMLQRVAEFLQMWDLRLSIPSPKSLDFV